MTLPADLYALPTYLDHIEAQGLEPLDLYSCPRCWCQTAPSGFAATAGLPGDLPPFVCHTCASGPFREALAAQEAAASPGVDWSGVRAQRDALLSRCDWTQMTDAPLDDVTREAWRSYRQELRDLSGQFEGLGDPALVAWPEPPE